MPVGIGYVRGLAASNDAILVGVSRKAPREERQDGDCQIHHFDRRTRIRLNVYNLPAAGNIYDIRILDYWDDAHGVMPFLNGVP